MAAIFLIALYLGSCNKQEHGVGVGLFNEDNSLAVHLIDTFQLLTYSKVEDSAISSGLGIVNLGFYNDPFFGKTSAGFYTQFEIATSGVDFGDTLNCDSIVLFLKLGAGELDFYGPENKPLRVDVHLISQSADFNKDSVYYTSSSFPINRESLIDPDFNNLVQPSFTDTVFYSRDSSFQSYGLGVLPIRLKKSFGQKLLDLNGTGVMESNENFLEEFKGIYVSVIGEDGEDILHIDMSDFGTSIILYYKEGSDQELDDTRFLIDDISAHFNSYQHDYEESGSLRLKAEMQDSTIGNQYFFTQSGGGFKGYVHFPTLLNLLDSNPLIPVNKAELIIPIEEGSTKNYAPPEQLFIFRINDDGKEELILDQYVGHVDGFYNAIDNQYRFNIIRHIQAVLNGELNPNGLVIKTSSPGNTPNRVILNGTLADTLFHKPMEFRLYYSSLIN